MAISKLVYITTNGTSSQQPQRKTEVCKLSSVQNRHSYSFTNLPYHNTTIHRYQ
ncbi:hypothetical protein Hanom_Chr10g00924651 [Helianthus anomalus]